MATDTSFMDILMVDYRMTPTVSGMGDGEPGSIACQTGIAFGRLEKALENRRCGLENVVSVSAGLTDPAAFGEFNAIYGEFMDGIDPKPARDTMFVRHLPHGAGLSLTALAYPLESGKSHAAVVGPGLPQPVAPYSTAISVSDGLVFTSGVVALGICGRIVDALPKEQVRIVLDSLGNALRAAGSGFDHVLRLDTYAPDTVHLDSLAHAIGTYCRELGLQPLSFPSHVMALPLGAGVEAKAIAYRK